MRPFRLFYSNKFVEWWGRTFHLGDIRGVTPLPFIVVIKNPYDQDISRQESVKRQLVIHHEWVHMQQMLELAIIFYLIWYYLDLLIGFIKYNHMQTAYRNIIFEREAYERTNRIKTVMGGFGHPVRPKWGWMMYYGKKWFKDRRYWKKFYANTVSFARDNMNEYVANGWEVVTPLHNKPKWYSPGVDRWYFKVVKR